MAVIKINWNNLDAPHSFFAGPYSTGLHWTWGLQNSTLSHIKPTYTCESLPCPSSPEDLPETGGHVNGDTEQGELSGYPNGCHVPVWALTRSH